jgi:beta-alanine--pyruvate transaminase
VFTACFQAGLLVRVTGDIIALSPPLIAERAHVDEIVGVLGDVIKAVA